MPILPSGSPNLFYAQVLRVPPLSPQWESPLNRRIRVAMVMVQIMTDANPGNRDIGLWYRVNPPSPDWHLFHGCLIPPSVTADIHFGPDFPSPASNPSGNIWFATLPDIIASPRVTISAKGAQNGDDIILNIWGYQWIEPS